MPEALLGLFALYICLLFLFVSPAGGWHNPYQYAHGEFTTFSLLLAGLVVATLFVYDTNVPTAVFCCSAGYTVQNFASGMSELTIDLCVPAPDKAVVYASPLHSVTLIASCLVVYVPIYLFVTRRLLKTGLHKVEDRSMLAMMVVVIAVIISFDLLIKGMVANGLEMRAMVLLRTFHGLACIFTVSAGFQLLIVRRAEAERDAAWQVLAERERQYETSRKNVDAINARVHDIRHAIGRLADEAHVDREVLASIVQEVDVYGTSLRTGNVALDTLLAERGLTCQRERIALSCIADGELLRFMAPQDVYALFSSLLDEAMQRTMQKECDRSISLSVREALGSVAIHVECTEAMGGTRPADNAATQQLCERYGATLATGSADGTWHANALFMRG